MTDITEQLSSSHTLELRFVYLFSIRLYNHHDHGSLSNTRETRAALLGACCGVPLILLNFRCYRTGKGLKCGFQPVVLALEKELEDDERLGI